MNQPVRILEWYRPDQSRSMRRVLVVGAVSMSTAGLVIAISFLTRQPEKVRQSSAALGLVLVASSAAFTSVTMRRILHNDRSVTIRTDGVVVQGEGDETILPWGELRAARWDAEREALVLERRGSTPLVAAWRPARIAGPDLAARIERERQRADMGLLK